MGGWDKHRGELVKTEEKKEGETRDCNCPSLKKQQRTTEKTGGEEGWPRNLGRVWDALHRQKPGLPHYGMVGRTVTIREEAIREGWRDRGSHQEYCVLAEECGHRNRRGQQFANAVARNWRQLSSSASGQSWDMAWPEVPHIRLWLGKERVLQLPGLGGVN